MNSPGELPIALILLIAILIKKDIIELDNIWSYFIKQVKVDGVFKDQEPDEIKDYHQQYLRILTKKYGALEKNILDPDYKAKEAK